MPSYGCSIETDGGRSLGTFAIGNITVANICLFSLFVKCDMFSINTILSSFMNWV